MPIRADLVLRIISCWIGSLALVVVLGGLMNQTGAGFWWAQLLGLVSLPLIVVAVVAALAFPRAIVRRPLVWSSAASVISLLVGFLVAQNAAVISLLVSVPSAVAFVLSLQRWPPKFPA